MGNSFSGVILLYDGHRKDGKTADPQNKRHNLGYNELAVLFKIAEIFQNRGKNVP